MRDTSGESKNAKRKESFIREIRRKEREEKACPVGEVHFPLKERWGESEAA